MQRNNSTTGNAKDATGNDGTTATAGICKDMQIWNYAKELKMEKVQIELAELASTEQRCDVNYMCKRTMCRTVKT